MEGKRLHIFFVIFSCIILIKTTAQEMPDEIRAALRDASEGFIVGIGMAKEESDGESIRLAEDLARGQIAQAMNYRTENED